MDVMMEHCSISKPNTFAMETLSNMKFSGNFFFSNKSKHQNQSKQTNKQTNSNNFRCCPTGKETGKPYLWATQSCCLIEGKKQEILPSYGACEAVPGQ